MKKKEIGYTEPLNSSSVAGEPAAAYSNLKVILGGANHLSFTINNDIDLIKLTRAGIKKSTLKSLSAYLGITLEQLSNLLHASHRNVQRKDDDALLDSYKSEKVLELASFVNKGIEIIGTESDFKEWLHSSILALGNKKPIDFLDTSFGIQIVLNTLGRLQMGVFS